MQIKLNRRTATALGLAMATAGTIAFAAGPASADVWTDLDTSHNAGIYNYSSVSSGKIYSGNEWDLVPASSTYPGDGVNAVCWIRGDDLQNLGNVWYYINREYYAWLNFAEPFTGYVYGGYVDDNWAFHNGLQHCSWGP